MTSDPQPTRLAPTDPWTVVEAARHERAPIVAEGCRSAVAWLYRGGSPSALSADPYHDAAEPVYRSPPGPAARLLQWLRSAASFSGSRPA